MGSSSSKFRKHLQNGDEYAAVQLYNASSDLRKGLDPNSSYGDNYNHDTPLHLAARHGMKSLLRIFLYELGGNPNKKNGRNETALHSVCMATNGRNFVVQQRRAECLMLVLQWRGAILADGEVERADLGAQDEKLNTGLHYCAASGLKRCVELLVSQSAPLFTENEQKQTPCDSAEMHGHNEIALYLESKMVFCQNEEENIEEMDNMLDQMESEEGYSGLRAQDLQEAKDQLLVETSDMLRIPLFTAEALLRNHEWSREMLLEAWMEDAVACCDKCGVIPPSTVASSGPSESNLHSDYGRQAISEQAPSPVITPPSPTETICDICTSTIGTSEEPVPMSCDHQFCRDCWERYLTGKIKEGEAHNITCPGFDCSKLVPVDVIETLVSRDMARRYLQFDIKAFVESNPNIKWCPYPGCGRAVRLPDSDNPMSPTFRGASDMSASDTSHAVDCGNGHIFCWECLGDAHEPASCDNWKIWHQKIGKVRPEECTCTLTGTEEETEVAANCLWLVTNSKSCPNCKSPIQKNEGCNHMKCSKCKHDFCWVCLEAWKKHSSATGGYFRCNRYEVVKEVEKYSDMAKADAEARNKRMQELNRFVHYYTRFRNHENSFKLEEPLLSTAKEKMVILAKAFTDPDSANLETKFVEDTVNQLLKARRVLKCSYVYGFYLEDTGYKKPIFEFMQTELEECTETLSEMIARPYLRTPRSKIIQTAHLVQRKRHEFVTAIAKGLVPPDSSPTMKKKRKKFSVELDDLDPANPWVKDPSGRHTNVSALLDWPEESDESDEEVSAPSGIASLSPRPSTRSADPAQPSGSSPGAEPSTRLGGREEPPPTTTEYFSDYQMDLLRALEMSRLQFLQEMGTLRPGSGDRSPRSPGQLSMREEQEHPPDSPAQLVLCDPPSGRQGVPVDVPVAAPGGPDRPGTSGGTHTQGGQLDQEIQQLLDMSHLTLQGEDQDLRLAIELSLQEAASKSPAADTETKTGPISSGVSSTGISGSTGVSSAGVAPPRDDALLSYNPDCSTTVTRVPNKSVEDLAAHHRYSMTSHTSGMTSHTIGMPSLTSDGGIINTNEYLGAYGGVTMETNLNRGLGTDSGLSNRRSKSYNHIVSQRGEAPDNPKSPQITAPNSFGLIKDIAVGNIIAADVDKTKNFADKDFSQVFYKKSFPGEVSYGGARGDGDARGEGEKSGPPLEDPWLRQVPRGHRPHSTGWSLPPGPPAPPHPRMYSDSVCHPRAYPDPPEEDPRADSRPLLGRQDSVDPADIVISSEVLESLLQGAERYAHISDEELELPLPPPPPPPPPAAANNNHRGDNHTDTTNSGANQPHATSNVRATNGDDNQNRRSSSDKDAVFV